jgi:hypothetical protein
MPTRFRRRFRNLSFGCRCSTERVGHQVSRRFRSFHTGPSCTVHQRFTGRFHVWEEEKEEKEEEQEEQQEEEQEEQEEQEERTQKHTTPISARTQQHTPSTPPTTTTPLPNVLINAAKCLPVGTRIIPCSDFPKSCLISSVATISKAFNNSDRDTFMSPLWSITSASYTISSTSFSEIAAVFFLPHTVGPNLRMARHKCLLEIS